MLKEDIKRNDFMGLWNEYEGENLNHKVKKFRGGDIDKKSWCC